MSSMVLVSVVWGSVEVGVGQDEASATGDRTELLELELDDCKCSSCDVEVKRSYLLHEARAAPKPPPTPAPTITAVMIATRVHKLHILNPKGPFLTSTT